MIASRSGGLLVALRSRLFEALRRRVVWVTDARRDTEGRPNDAAALVAVLGREHYQERRRAYPVRGLRDLHRVLALELANAPATLTLIGPLRDDRREVTFFELDPRVLERVGRALWLVPESLPLALTLPAQRVAAVERNGLRYFLAASGVSQLAGGAVSNPTLFALAVGLDADAQSVALGVGELPSRLLQGLRRLPTAAWLRLLSPTLRTSATIAWRPLVTLTAVGLTGYLLLASAYLSLAESLRKKELDGLGPEVAELLETQRQVERLGLEQQALARVLAERRPSYAVWHVAALAWQKGALLEGFALSDGRLTLRGSAPVATEVLGALAADPSVTDARFGAPVRQVVDREQFLITLTLADGVDRG